MRKTNSHLEDGIKDKAPYLIQTKDDEIPKNKQKRYSARPTRRNT